MKAIKYPQITHIIIVDDGSTIPVTLPQNKKTHLLRHRLNLGKGAALKTGIDYAFSQGVDAAIMMDSDGQHDPKDLPLFIKALQDHDLVFGYRDLNYNMPLMRRLGNFLVPFYLKFLFNTNIKDILSGYRAFSKKAYSVIKWDASDYGVETEIVIRYSKHSSQLKTAQVPIHTIYHDAYKGFSIIESVQLFLNIILWKFTI